ncbi:MAG: hypothetical protein EOP51_02365 [Sphingobacteriales bacterium]|nr:MAG: hypothetical protein EOP51_02365 [Sphingobacteriales bacterium]
MRVIINGWQEGFGKVAMTKLQVEMLGLGLKEAKENVEAILEYEAVEIEVADLDIAKEFVEKSVELGAVATIIQ